MLLRDFSVSIGARGHSSALASSALFFILNGCSGEGSGDQAVAPRESGMCVRTSIQSCGPGPWDPFGIALSLAWISGQCTTEVLCTNGAVETNFDEGIVTDDFIAENWTTFSTLESEPNDSPSEATPYVIRGNSGLLVTGTLDGSSDSADFLALSFGQDSSQSGYTAYLCRTPDDCLQPWYSGNEIYIDLLDQNELVVQTTTMTSAHFLTFQGTAGVRYFIAVRVADLRASSFDYQLVITD